MRDRKERAEASAAEGERFNESAGKVEIVVSAPFDASVSESL